MKSRVPAAVIGGLTGFTAYVVVVVTIADRLQHTHWAVQAAYFLVVGSLWVLPVRWLMYWAARLR